MANHFDLEEQEQIDQLKHFWKQWGTLITAAVVVVCGGFAAYNGYNQVLVGPAHPYLKGGVPMDFPGVSYGVGDLFGFQARAFLEQVARMSGGLPPVASFADGLRDLEIINAVISSAAACTLAASS